MRRSSIILFVAVLCAGSMAMADNHRFLNSAGAQRIGAPQAAGSNRISAPSAPSGPARPNAPTRAGSLAPSSPAIALSNDPSDPAISGLAPAPGPVDWYWEAVSPSLTTPARVSVQAAVAALRRAPDGFDVPAPQASAMKQLAERYGAVIAAATAGTDVSPALVLAVISVESAGQSDAVSSAGAQGLMQLMPPTAARFGVENSFDVAENIMGGTAYLDWLLTEFDNRVIFALAGYNAGEGAVRDNNGVPPYAETRAYVPKVLAAWQVARTLCVTPPVVVRDACVFVTAADDQPAAN